MYDIKWIREHPEAFDRGLKRRGLEKLSGKLLALDEKRRAAITKFEQAQARRNSASKEIGEAKKAKDEACAAKLMAEVNELKTTLPALEEEQKKLAADLDKQLAQIPNMPLDEVPEGTDASGNVERHVVGKKRDYAFKPKQHFELGEALGMMDFELAAKLSGARFVVLQKGLARMERALGQFFLDVHTGEKHGYTEVNPPILVGDDVMFGTAQLPKFENDQFSTIPRHTSQKERVDILKRAVLELTGRNLKDSSLVEDFPLIVGEGELVSALSLFNITMTLSMAIGFLLLGSVVSRIFPPFTLHVGMLTVHVHSIDMLFVMVAVLYLVCAILILAIPKRVFDESHLKKRRSNAGNEATKTIASLWQDIVEGWHFVRKDRILFFSVVQLSVVGNIMLLIGELAGPFVQQVLHHPAADMGIILAPAAVGLVGASIVMPRVTERVDKVRLTVIGFIGLAIGFVLLVGVQWLAGLLYDGRAASSALLLWTTMALVFVLGVAIACVNIPTQTMMQEHAPEAVRGRVFALQFMMYNTGSIPILLFAGFFAQYIGFNWLIVLISTSLLLFCWWGTWYVKRG